MQISELLPRIFHIRYPTQQELCKTFLRFQEYYESPRFRGKIFTLEEYKRWYISHSPRSIKEKRFTYYKDWNGFNIPSRVLRPFFEGKFSPLSREEVRLLRACEHISYKRFYLIGTWKEATLQHEIAHGLFYTNRRYKQEVLKILALVLTRKREEIFDHFKNSCGYHASVFMDEMHAYILTGRIKGCARVMCSLASVYEHHTS